MGRIKLKLDVEFEDCDAEVVAAVDLLCQQIREAMVSGLERHAAGHDEEVIIERHQSESGVRERELPASSKIPALRAPGEPVSPLERSQSIVNCLERIGLAPCAAGRSRQRASDIAFAVNIAATDSEASALAYLVGLSNQAAGGKYAK